MMNTAVLLKALLVTATTVSAIAPLTVYTQNNFCDAGSATPAFTWDTFTENECYSFNSSFLSLQTGTIAEGCSATFYRNNLDCTGASYVIDDADSDNCFGLGGDVIKSFKFFACGSQ
ncbi:hypothetical protein TRIATDRAFT_87502 [Trichoderma atroviride IMI 206040]|uniref:Small secreted protein n=1 Tax=Hypocrea atroviridis (strain ATCC 20476 / IMI 206040) TaxID=452589 RepID=G9NYF2_HYPAI|nr:uncharacterized protein TRIATDRAFT_87502 [Trichoderma atroviride IMI 206040]EHK44604.1 hypothetical protein TRIATDRAFT_87502 [Trichoderma atroviride IMI 206040]